jgi:manganese-dependent ADP-ribose/CDP-alcohol diphosphatase
LKQIFGEPYYAFSPQGSVGWRVLLLDSYDLNCIDTIESDQSTEEAFQYLHDSGNKNELRVRDGSVNWRAGLVGLKERFVPFNGGMRPAQLEWLHGQLSEAETANERVVVLTHVPIAPGSAGNVCLAWNYSEILDVLDAHQGTVAAVFTGHDHTGGYTERNGVHYLTLPSPLHAGEEVGGLAHATVDVHADRFVVHCVGLVGKTLGGSVLELPFPARGNGGAGAEGSKL